MICDRCGAKAAAMAMSYFNRDRCCMACLDDERLAPGFAHAKAAEENEVRHRNYNFAGVGLAPIDATFLKMRREKRNRRE